MRRPNHTATDGHEAGEAGVTRRETPDPLRLLAALLVIAVTTGLLLGTAALMLAVAPG